jgi:hypothetical protein
LLAETVFAEDGLRGRADSADSTGFRSGGTGQVTALERGRGSAGAGRCTKRRIGLARTIITEDLSDGALKSDGTRFVRGYAASVGTPDGTQDRAAIGGLALARNGHAASVSAFVRPALTCENGVGLARGSQGHAGAI